MAEDLIPPVSASVFPDSGLQYERDIAPLQQRFFRNVMNNPRIRPEVAANMATQYSANAAQSYVNQAKMAEAEQVSAGRKLQYESTLFALEREREKYNRERSMMRDLAPIQQQLDSIISDPNTTAEQKTFQLGQFGVKNSGLLSTNDAAATAFKSASMSVVKPPPKFTVADALRSGADPEYISQWATKYGVQSPDDEAPLGVVLPALKAADDRRIKAISTTKEEERRLMNEASERRALRTAVLATKEQEATYGGQAGFSESDRNLFRMTVQKNRPSALKDWDKLSQQQQKALAVEAVMSEPQSAASPVSSLWSK